MSEKTKIFIETDIETFFRPKFSHRDSQNNYKSLDTEKSRDEMYHFWRKGWKVQKAIVLFVDVRNQWNMQ